MRRFIVAYGLDKRDLKSNPFGQECIVLSSEENNLGLRYEESARTLFQRIKSELKSRLSENLLVQLVVIGDGEGKVFRGLAGMLKSANKENPKLLYQIIECEKETPLEELVYLVEKEQHQPANIEVRYVGGERYVKELEETQFDSVEAMNGVENSNLPWKEQGVYLITGGMGGLGLLFAKEMAKRLKKVTLILTGRRPQDQKITEELEQLEKENATAFYQAVDITNETQTKELMEWIMERFHGLHGILHCAGITKDNFIIKKTEEEFMSVLGPKVSGLVNLDETSKDLPLDFIILFSSQSGEEGNAGQADYATGNAFMDAYVEYRNELCQNGKRQGKTISVNWPLWEEGGMQVPEEIKKNMYVSRGIVPLETSSGFYALFQAFERNYGQVMVMEGDTTKISKKGIQTKAVSPVDVKEKRDNMKEEMIIREKLIKLLKEVISENMGLSTERLNVKETFESYGIDSVMIMDMTAVLERDFGELPKTLFFEYTNIQELADYFMENHQEKLSEMFGEETEEDDEPVNIRAEKKVENRVIVEEKKEEPQAPNRKIKKPLPRKMIFTERNRGKTEVEDIAIIGLAGRYPQADNLEEFWNNLCDGKDCITEIPKDHWDYHLYYSEDQNGAIASKWGGFLNDFDKFDPLFFHISYDDAIGMDPQERQFLQCAYETLQDAGYTPDSLKGYCGDGLESNVGVFVGVMYAEYQMHAAMEQAHGNYIAANGVTSAVANRVSYCFNLHGPSVTINTMCSSSLLAIHQACQSIQCGDCEMALAGGVNLSEHPHKYIALSHENFMSTKGRCEAFGEGGDGYVPGEGVGAVLLKPLDQAIADNDHIYGVIKATTVNHGGKANGFTVPNPTAQTDVVKRAYKKAGINPKDVSYIEAHGTGTSLGDPIEVRALAKVFKEYTKEKQFCSIGSVKSNIGHLEGAAGIASVTKVLLQMKYKMLVPSIHSDVLNPNIDFTKSPFYVQHKLEHWETRTELVEGVEKQCPRIAGISAFGAGGTNVHIVLEEYCGNEVPKSMFKQNQYCIVLSAKNKQSLKESMERLLHAVSSGSFGDDDLPSIAYTLQVGREQLEYRFAVIVTSIQELREKLTAYLQGDKPIRMYVGEVKAARNAVSVLHEDEDFEEVLSVWFRKEKYEKLLSLWVNGMDLDWEIGYPKGTPMKVSLPTYPFEKERFWLETKERNGLQGRDAVQEGDVVKNGSVPHDQVEVQIPKQKMFPQDMREKNVGATNNAAIKAETNVAQLELGEEQLKEELLTYLKELFSTVSKIPVNRIEEDVDLEEYGIDSIMVKDLTEYLERDFNNISITVFFEFHQLQDIASYLLGHFKEEANALVSRRKGVLVAEEQESSEIREERKEQYHTQNERIYEKQIQNTIHLEKETNTEKKSDDIAIIGMSGRFPGAENVDDFWKNLKNGKDCVTEIPKERWSYEDFYDKEKGKRGKLYGKWGGFIKDADKFDPLFFNISPDNAETIDPMERIFLQSVYETLEDAGYTRKSLSKYKNLGLEGDVGVFVGATFMEYQFYGVQNQVKGNNIAVTGLPSSIANSVSYFCNFHGPSMTVDTMCSSSLTALHMACSSIKNGECQVAVAGGVNLSLHPNKYLFLSQNYFLSSKGRCEAFGNEGDGYVPGEGVVSVLLKPLEQAKADGDHIYGVIKATAVNHGGKTNGFTVPNLNAQRQVVSSALLQAGVHPRTISYIEAHGTGTSLGDPIEIAGLTSAYEEYTKDKNFCSIGSVKSNIGHLEAASGLASLVKVLLQMKYKELVPSIHCDMLNDKIKFEQTPFYVQRYNEPWKEPILAIDGEYKEYPRRAGISSFGAGGSNAHVIVEEYVSEQENGGKFTDYFRGNDLLGGKGLLRGKNQSKENGEVAIVLSGKTKETLRGRAEQLLTWLQENEETNLANIAYTLQVGRETMEERFGFLATSIAEMRDSLYSFVAGMDVKNSVQGYFSKNNKNAKLLKHDVERELSVGNIKALLNLWGQGCEIEWEQLYQGDNKPSRISLPTYPFEKVRCWLDDFVYERVYQNSEEDVYENEQTKIQQEESTLWRENSWRENSWRENPWRENGTYIMINGISSAGRKAVEELAQSVDHVTVILTGMKNPAMEEQIQQVKQLSNENVSLEFYYVDDFEIEKRKNLMDIVRTKHPRVDGIFCFETRAYHGLLEQMKNEETKLDFLFYVPEEVQEMYVKGTERMILGRAIGNQKTQLDFGKKSITNETQDSLYEQVLECFIQLIAHDLKISTERIHPEEEFQDYGIDSIRGMDLIKTMREDFPSIDGTFFLTCHTIEGFAQKLLQDYEEECRRWVSKEQS